MFKYYPGTIKHTKFEGMDLVVYSEQTVFPINYRDKDFYASVTFFFSNHLDMQNQQKTEFNMVLIFITAT